MISQKKEAFGLFLILIAFGLHTFHSVFFETFEDDIISYTLNEKLNILNQRLDSITQVIPTYNNADTTIASIPIDPEREEWRKLQSNLENKDQSKLFKYLNVILYVIGSSIIIWAKYTEKFRCNYPE